MKFTLISNKELYCFMTIYLFNIFSSESWPDMVEHRRKVQLHKKKPPNISTNFMLLEIKASFNFDLSRKNYHSML